MRVQRGVPAGLVFHLPVPWNLHPSTPKGKLWVCPAGYGLAGEGVLAALDQGNSSLWANDFLLACVQPLGDQHP